ncbi:hypothetical protein CsSME_00017029 [Camellia sinensis var. sinensis]
MNGGKDQEKRLSENRRTTEHIAGLGESPEDRCEMEDNIAKNICQEIATLPFSPDLPFNGLMNATGVFLIMLDLVKASRKTN